MEIHEYAKMYEFEENYWWYRGLRAFLRQLIKKIRFDCKTSVILDAGCGTGANLKFLKDHGYCNLYGFDSSEEAIKYCHQRGLLNVHRADINNIPYEDHTFDLILCLDVFECSEVDEQVAYKELLRVLKPGGTLILNIAAFQFLISEHDRAVHSTKRYSKKEAMKVFYQDGNVMHVQYVFSFTFSLIVGYRIFKKIFCRKEEYLYCSDLNHLPRLLNEFLYFLVFIESKIFQFIPFPFGTSLIIEVSKGAS